MSFVEFLSKTEGMTRQFISNTIAPKYISLIYSNARKHFISALALQEPEKRHIEPLYNTKMWGIDFACPLFNAAGMFKKGEAYYLCAAQGAGAYLAGTTTALERRGNIKKGVEHPFIPYPSSASAQNWMGLPNEGHAVVAKRISRLEKKALCPIGASVSSAPEQSGLDALKSLTVGLQMYDLANVDFIELNESCPNVPNHATVCSNGLDNDLTDRIEYLSENFLNKRKRNLPVIVKFSNDTNLEQVPQLIDLLISAGFDGVNFGNTSTNYELHRSKISSLDRAAFDYFIKEYGGGMSGAVLKSSSLNLCRAAVDHLKSKSLNREFHIIRTGGVESLSDLEDSRLSGVSANQWFTGYFDSFAKYGHNIYQVLFG